MSKLLDHDIIERADGPTEWVSPIVTPPKPSDPTQIRLCVDMRNANEAILRTRHITPTIDDLINDLNGATIFSKIDLTAGYHQLELAPESRPITTFSTHLGLFRYKRLNFGVNAAAEHFQHTIQSVLSGINGAKNVSDDIIVFGKDRKEHDFALHQTLSRLHSKGLTINRDKLDLHKPSIEFFGYIFSAKGISPAPSKVNALKSASLPRNASEIRSFLGMAQYSSRFIYDYATISEPLRKLTHKDATWKFGPKERHSFNAIRNALQESATNAYFDPTKKTEVLVDASPVGIAAILTQDDKPITFASRSLSNTEQRYSQLEREALAVVWSCEHLNVYLHGHPFTTKTDHQPLVSLWKKQNLPARLSRWALRLQPYDMTLVFRPGHDNPSDYLSRHPVHTRQSSREELIAEEYVNFIVKTSTPCAISPEQIRKATAADPTLSQVIQAINTNQWHRIQTVPNVDRSSVKAFKDVKEELTAVNNILLRGSRIVIPQSLHQAVINLAHQGHQGMSKTKALLRSKVWFPGMDNRVENTVRDCLPCQANSTQTTSAPITMTPMPNNPWESISMDFCGPLPSGEYLLIVTDQYSKYPVVEILRTTAASVVIPVMEKIFGIFSYPSTVKTDNGPPFNGAAWSSFMESSGCHHHKITPLWPQANGQAEAFNKPLMKAVRAAHLQGLSWRRELHNFLLAYRVTPHSTTQLSPFRLLFGREPKTKLPSLNPNTPPQNFAAVRENVQTAQNKAKTSRHTPTQPEAPVLHCSQDKLSSSARTIETNCQLLTTLPPSPSLASKDQ